MRTFFIGLAAAAFLGVGSLAASTDRVDEVRLSAALAAATPAARAAWSFSPGGEPAGNWTIVDGRVTVRPRSVATDSGGGEFAVASYTIPAGAAGFYAVADSMLRRDTEQPGRIELRVFVRRAGGPASAQPAPAVATQLDAGEVFDFDSFLGYLDVGDAVCVGIGPAGDATGDRTEIDFKIIPAPAIPVSVLTEDFGHAAAVAAPGGWWLSGRVPAGSAAARRFAWGRDAAGGGFVVAADAARVSLPADGREAVAAFRVPHSGYYAVHEAWFAAAGGAVEARLYVGTENRPRHTVRATPAAGRTSLNAEVGYVQRGDTIYVAWAGLDGVEANVAAGMSIVEWAPRRAPLRVRRGDDGFLDVFEPEAPRRAVDVPPARWVTVPATRGDATAAIRAALARAQTAQRGNEYTGVRLEAGATYVVATEHVGTLFEVRGAQRLIFDGHGATLRVSSPELMRKRVGLFAATGSRNVVFADVTVEAISVPFTVGEILDVSPPGASNQTVTFRVDPGAVDPLGEISRSGQADGFAYDARIPGRLAEGAWTHFPGDGNPSLRAGGEPGVFTHRVRRTGDSIRAGQKWLIKNKGAGVVYLTTSGGAENVTLSGVIGRAAGGSHLLFWQTSGVNLLDCRFEPDGGAWIGSSSDSVHGRGREGVWIEDTLFRGTCEDIMNTYGENMVVEADADPTDAVMSIRMFTRSVETRSGRAMRLPTAENLTVGDQLVFFNPRSGRVLGHASVRAIEGGRFTLSSRIDDIETWEEGDGHGATMVYNTRVAGRFFVRDSRLMDSMRFGVYVKARGGVIFHTQFEGLSSAGVFAVNEPEWPEGPPATHLWVQGCLFSQNNHGYMSKHRAFMTVDPADISVYTRRLGAAAASTATDFQAHVTRGQFANSHMKFVGNVFHDWRGLGIAVRNSRNVRIDDNLFLAPVDDPLLRRTLAADPLLAGEGGGRYAAIFLDSVDGVRLSGNRFYGLPAGDAALVRGADVANAVESDNRASADGGRDADFDLVLSFGEWFGAISAGVAPAGGEVKPVELNGAAHGVGRLGAGVFFNGQTGPAVLAPPPATDGKAQDRFSLGLWVRPGAGAPALQVIHTQGNATSGLVLAIDRGRLVAGLWQAGGYGAWLDLGAATPDTWQHVVLVFDGPARLWRGFVDGAAAAATSQDVPELSDALAGAAAFGGVHAATRSSADRVVPAGSAGFSGGVDEFRLARRVLTAAEVATLALRRPADAP